MRVEIEVGVAALSLDALVLTVGQCCAVRLSLEEARQLSREIDDKVYEVEEALQS